MNFAGRQVACEELSEPLTQAGLGEGVWRLQPEAPGDQIARALEGREDGDRALG